MTKRITLLVGLLLGTMVLFAQTIKPYPASDLKVTWEMLENNHQGKVQSLCKLTLTNAGKQSLPAKGWKVYFNFGRTIKPSVKGNVSIKQINGELYEMTPTNDFSPLAAKQSIVIEYVSSGALVNYTDAPVGFYMLWEADNSYTNMGQVSIVPSTQEKQIKRTPKDNLGIITPEIIYNQNATIANFDDNTLCPILPTPVNYTKGEGKLTIFSIDISASAPNSLMAAKYLREKLNNLLVAVPKKEQMPYNNRILFTVNTSLENEAYELSVSTKDVEIRANSESGFFYGVQSLLQLMPSDVFAAKQANISIPCVEVADAPRFGFRAIHLDVSRNFQSKAEILKILDVMALYKINTFHLHFSDDDGWRIEMPSLPELTQVGSRRGAGSELEMLIPTYGSGGNVNNTSGTGHYSVNDFIEILKYATERHIQVIPEIETPGHARAAIKSMEARYHKYMKEGNKTEAERYRLTHPNDTSKYKSVQSWNDNVMDVSMPSVYVFVERVVDDLIDMYKKAGAPLHTIHMGGDEVPVGAWEQSPAFAQLQTENSAIKNVGDLWYYYFDKVNKILKQRNLFVSGWEEAGVRFTERDGVKLMVPNPDFANQHFQVDVWNNVLGWGAEDLAYKMANAGYKVVLSCVSNNYFDMAYYKAFDEPGYYWGSYADLDRPFAFIPYDYYKNSTIDLNGNPISADAFKGKERLTEYGKTNIVGVKGLLWSETLLTPQAAEYMLLPKLIALAERAWSVNPSWATELDNAKSEQLYTVALHKFFNVVGKYQLERLNSYAGGFNYRIPSPGAVIKNGKAHANMQLPGFTLRYTTNGEEPTVKSKVYTQAIDFTKGTFKVKAFSNNGRSGRTAVVSN